MSPLPKKCCAKCGFLYGLAYHPASREDAVFDPDLIRSEEYPPSMDGKPGFITSQPYGIQRYYLDIDERKRSIERAYPPEVRSYCWRDTVAVYCYMKKFRPIPIDRKILGAMTKQEENNVLSYQVSASWGEVKTIIRRDRQDCDGFFEYHPGYTPAQHVQLLLEEKRVQRAEAHERRLTEWSVGQERRLTEWSNSQESRWRRISLELENKRTEQENRWKKTETHLMELATRLTIGLLIFAALGAIATVVSALVAAGVIQPLP